MKIIIMNMIKKRLKERKSKRKNERKDKISIAHTSGMLPCFMPGARAGARGARGVVGAAGGTTDDCVPRTVGWLVIYRRKGIIHLK